MMANFNVTTPGGLPAVLAANAPSTASNSDVQHGHRRLVPTQTVNHATGRAVTGH